MQMNPANAMSLPNQKAAGASLIRVCSSTYETLASFPLKASKHGGYRSSGISVRTVLEMERLKTLLRDIFWYGLSFSNLCSNNTSRR